MARLLTRLFAIDLRALGVFRVLLGIVLLLDYLGRLPDLDAHYAGDGIMPFVAVQQFHGENLWLLLSPYMWNGSREWALSLMLIGILFAALFTIGYKSRFVNFVSWFLLISLHTRAPLILEGGDVYIRQMLFWCLFLPVSARYSLDGGAAEHIAHKKPLPTVALSMGTAGLLLQVGIVYWFNALAKSGTQWRVDFSALYYALSLEPFTTPVGIFVREHLRFLLVPFTIATVLLEGFGPFIAFFPVWTERIRPYVVAAFLFFHIFGIGLLMDVGPFVYIAAIPWVLFLPPAFWDKLPTVWERLPLPNFRTWLTTGYERLVDIRSHEIATRVQRGLPPARVRATLLGDILAFFFLGYILIWNVRDAHIPYISPALPSPRKELIWLTRVDQYWGMFAPYPTIGDGWIVIPAVTMDATQFDMYKMRAPVNYSKPQSVHEFYKNSRWRKYLTNLADSGYAVQRRYYCDWLAREWNKTHPGPQSLYKMWFCFVEEDTLPNFQQPKPRLRVLYVQYGNAPLSGLIDNDLPPNAPAELLPPKNNAGK